MKPGIRIASLCFPLAALSIQGGLTAQDEVVVQDVEVAEQKKEDPIEKILAAEGEERDKALIAYMQKQIATNAIFTGQYAALRKLGESGVATMHAWMKEAPEGPSNAAGFRLSCLRAIRDMVTEKPSEELSASLNAVAKDVTEPQGLRFEAMYALAQFGDDSFVKKEIEKLEKRRESPSAAEKGNALIGLANIYYNTRQFAKAVESYQGIFKLLDERQISITQGLSTHYYNCACNMALAGQSEAALEMVEKALKIGKQRGDMLRRALLETDMDISSLRKDGKIKALIAKYYAEGEVKKKAKAKADGYGGDGDGGGDR